MSTRTKLKIVFCVLSVVCSLALTASFARAASISVTPVVFDYKAKARDIIDGTLTITNMDIRRMVVYPVVNNINASTGSEEFIDPAVADYSSSLANWISISRGEVDLNPGESHVMNFRIEVNLTAKPGDYHASISFPTGSFRYEAESHMEGAASVAVNLEVQEDIKENLELKGFTSDKNFFWGLPASFSYTVANVGNRSESPQGEIIVYDNRGKEVMDLAVNKENREIAAGASGDFSSIWKGDGAFGQYKALLLMSYGAEGAEKLQDTVFFWVLPWQRLGIIAAILFAISMGMAFLLHKRFLRVNSVDTGSGNAQKVQESAREAGHGVVIGHLTSENIPHVVDLRHPHAPGKHRENLHEK